MIRIQFPSLPFKRKKEDGIEMIFDDIRKRWVVLTPEEWVRQNIIQYLVHIKKYPAKLFSVEKEIMLGELKKRCDIVIYRESIPWMIIECKEMRVGIDVTVLEQVLRYHTNLQVPYLVITNAEYCYGFEKKDGEFVEVDDFPEY